MRSKRFSCSVQFQEGRQLSRGIVLVLQTSLDTAQLHEMQIAVAAQFTTAVDQSPLLHSLRRFALGAARPLSTAQMPFETTKRLVILDLKMAANNRCRDGRKAGRFEK